MLTYFKITMVVLLVVGMVWVRVLGYSTDGATQGEAAMNALAAAAAFCVTLIPRQGQPRRWQVKTHLAADAFALLFFATASVSAAFSWVSSDSEAARQNGAVVSLLVLVATLSIIVGMTIKSSRDYAKAAEVDRCDCPSHTDKPGE